MITQAFKRWINKLFSWWPWKRSTRSEILQPVNNLNLSSAQDASWNPLPAGPEPRPGITSVVVEQERDVNPISNEKPDAEESLMQHQRPTTDGIPTSSTLSLVNTTKSAQDPSPSMPTFEQKLQFLRYLVNHGIINEGFTEEHAPRQYKRKKQ